VTDIAESVVERTESTVEDTELRAELIAYQLESALEAERERQQHAQERERLAAKVTELEQRTASLTMTEAARLAGLNLDSQPARYFLHHYANAGHPPDPERILRDYCAQVLGKPVPEAHRRRLQRLTTRR
jgi:hypothetical protein